MLSRIRWLGVVLAILTVVSPAWPCNVPVFRYALERWTPDDCTVTVFHRGSLTPEQEQQIARLRKFGRNDGGRANLLVQTADVGGELSKPLEFLWKSQPSTTLPWIVVEEPNPEEGTVWQTFPLSEKERFDKLLDSPARRQIANHLLKGESVVWLLVESGNAEVDVATAKLLEETSAKLVRKLKLPDGIGEPGSTLASSLPLRISFTTVRVARKDPEEAALVGLLGHIFPTALAEKGPAVVPIFGRGRALDAVAGEELTDETLTEAAVFLTGRCSCQVKKLNPGVDLLFTADWESIFAENTSDPASSSQELPLVAIPESETPSCAVSCDEMAALAIMPRILMWSLGGAGVGVVFGTLLLLLRRGGAA